jgi:hypothetical protein
MTRTEDLLRAALQGAVTPPTRIVDPLADLDRRVSRARLRLSITAAIAVFVVTAAVVVPLTLIGRGDSAPAVASPDRALTTWAAGHVVAVASGGGSVWSLEKDHIARATGHADIVQRDPVTGAVEKHWSVHAGYDSIAYGAGKVWVWGSGASAAPQSIASALDPTTGVVSATAHFGRENAFDSVVFVAGHAWAAIIGRQRALRFSFPGGHSRIESPHVTGLTSVVALGPTSVGLVTGTGAIEAVDPSDTREYRVAAGSMPWVPVGGATSGHSFWVQHRLPHAEGLYRQDLTTGRIVGSTVRLGGIPSAVVADPAGGLYIEANDPRIGGLPSLSYYSAEALTATSPHPKVIRRFDSVDQLAIDPAGGLVYTTGEGALIHWHPAAAPLR